MVAKQSHVGALFSLMYVCMLTYVVGHIQLASYPGPFECAWVGTRLHVQGKKFDKVCSTSLALQYSDGSFVYASNVFQLPRLLYI